MVDRRFDRMSPGTFLLCCLVLAVFGAGPATVSAQAVAGPLRILLTNDDGYDAPGIVALREALIEGGHNVIVVAPSTNQSGSSARLSTSGTLHYAEASKRVWHVDGSPADAVGLALGLLMRDSLPDLVVSGTNFGQNIGTGTSHSGTVGAAVTAVRHGIPAVAISAQILVAESSASPTPFPSTIAAFEPAGRFALDLVNQLLARPGDDGALLPAQTLLNVNYPALPREEVRGVRFVPVSDANSFSLVFSESEIPGEVRVGLGPPSRADVQENTEVSLLAEGYITINLINANGDAGEATLESVSRRLRLQR